MQIATAPSRHQVDPNLEYATDFPQRPELDRVKVPVLDPADLSSRHVRQGGEIVLPPSAPNPH
jgi:hypothetical protein